MRRYIKTVPPSGTEVWTDYPIPGMSNDIPKRCLLLRYDGNKYVTVKIITTETILEIKAGYLFHDQSSETNAQAQAKA